MKWWSQHTTIVSSEVKLQAQPSLELFQQNRRENRYSELPTIIGRAGVPT